MDSLGIAIIGCGNGGMALAGWIASKGYRVTIFEGMAPSEPFLQLQKEKTVYIKGSVEAKGTLREVTTDMQAALSHSEMILVVVPAYAHASVFEALIPHLRDGHRVVIIPGNFGTLLLKKMMKQSGCHKKISISELASLPFACRKTAYDTVEVYRSKRRMKIATSPAKANQDVLCCLNTVTDIFFPGENVLEISLDNINCVLHPLPVLLNVGAIEKNPERFRHYIDGISPAVSDMIHRMDEERLETGRRFGVKLLPVLDQLKMYYGENGSADVFDYVNSGQSPYKELYGQSINSRYLTEDIPYLVVPAMLLGREMGVDAAMFELCVKAASLLHGIDYAKKGTDLVKLGIESFTKEGLLAAVS